MTMDRMKVVFRVLDEQRVSCYQIFLSVPVSWNDSFVFIIALQECVKYHLYISYYRYETPIKFNLKKFKILRN